MLKRLASEQAGPWIVAGGVILAAVWLGSILFVYSNVYKSVYHDHATSKEDAARKDQFKNKCSNVVVIEELRRCFENQIAADWDTQRDQEDLYAQKQMADWAWWMVVVSVAVGVPSLAMTSAGVILVYLNLKEAQIVSKAAISANSITEKALEHAQKASQTELRPWLSLKNLKMQARVIFPKDQPILALNVDISVDLVNSGFTPAHYVRLVGKVFRAEDDAEIDAFFQRFMARHTSQKRSVAPQTTTLDEFWDTCKIPISGKPQTNGIFHVAFVISYETPFDEVRRQTTQVFQMGDWGKPGMLKGFVFSLKKDRGRQIKNPHFSPMRKYGTMT